MKKGTRLWGLFALFLLVFCSSCKDDETNDDPLCTLKVQAQRNEISGDGGDVVFDVTSNGAWSYTIDQQEQWLTEKSKSAERLTLTAAVGSDAERKATVTFTSEADSKLKETITITQQPRPTCSMSSSATTGRPKTSPVREYPSRPSPAWP